MVDVGARCPEHVWSLSAVVPGDDGRLTQQYVCQRCQIARLVGPDDEPPGNPDLPI